MCHRYLSGSENRWLKNLRDNLDNKEAVKFYDVVNTVEDKDVIKPYIDVVYRANIKAFKEVVEMEMSPMIEILLETKKGRSWIKEQQVKAKIQARAQGKAEGETDTRNSIARNMKSGGMSNKLISQYTGLPLSKVKNLKVAKKTRETHK